MAEDLILARVDKARLLLAQAKDAESAKKVMDMAHAAEIYAHRQKLSIEAVNHAHAIRLDAQRLLGEFLKDAPKATGTQLAGRDTFGGFRKEPPKNIPTYAESGLTKKEAFNAQKLADIAQESPEAFEQMRDNKKTLAQVRREQRKAAHAASLAEAGDHLVEDCPWKLTQDQAVIPCTVLITDPPYGILTEHWEPGAGGIEDVTRLWATRWDACEAEFILTFFSQRFMWSGRHWFDESFIHYDFQQLLVWHYPNNKSPQSQHGFKQTWEPIFFYRKKGSERQIKVQSQDWGDGLTDFDAHVAAVPQTNFNNIDCKVHPAQKPLSVMVWLVAATTMPGDIVCDPFCGSGTTGIAASKLGRRFYGIETNSEYLNLAKGRLSLYG